MLVLYPTEQFFTLGGLPLAGGAIYTYQSGTSTPKAVYSDSTGTTPLPNPVILDANGMKAFWLNGSYKIVVQDSNGVQISSNDNVSYSPYQTTIGFSEWLLQSLTSLTYISATQFSCTTDMTPTFQVNRRIQATVSAGTIYGTITASSYSVGVTTVTVVWDSGSLDSGLSAVYVGVLSETNLSVPQGLVVPQFYQNALKTRTWTVPAETTATLASQQTVQAGGLIYAADTGVADAYVVTLAPVPAWTAGLRFSTQITHANATTTPTINLNGLGVKTIVRPNGSAVFAGDLPLNWIAEFEYYDPTHAALLNPYYPAAGTVGATQATALIGAPVGGLAAGTVYGPVTGDTLITYIGNAAAVGACSATVYTDGANPPTTLIFASSSALGSDGGLPINFSFICRKGNYYKIVVNNLTTQYYITWTLGS